MKKLLFCCILVSVSISETFAQCQASFTWTQTTNNVISFTNTTTGSTPATAYHWTFGDATTYWSQNPVHTYILPGTYYVCLQAVDSMSASCNSTFCDSITVTGTPICTTTVTTTSTMASCSTCTDGSATALAAGGTPPYTYNWQTTPPQTTATATGLAPGTYTCCITDAVGCTACNTATINAPSTCQANFTWTQTANNTIAFTNTSTGTTVSTVYYWTYGDATANYAQDPVHLYNTPGTYVVCLWINDSLGTCNNTFCDTITVTGVNCNNINVTVAAIDVSCPTCNDGAVTAVPTGGTSPFTYLWSTGGTTQSMNNLVAGTYTVCITDVVGCTACGSALVDSVGICDSYFTINYVSPQTYNGINMSSGMAPITYLWSWGDATTSNTAYPTHTYTSPGFYSICLSITDGLGCTSTYCDSFNIARLETPFSVINITIYPNPAGIPNAVEPENYFHVFPNPASDYLYIDYSLAASANTRITLYDVMGKTLWSFRNDMSEGKQQLVFDISSLEQGIYVLSLQSAHYSVTKTISTVK